MTLMPVVTSKRAQHCFHTIKHCDWLFGSNADVTTLLRPGYSTDFPFPL